MFHLAHAVPIVLTTGWHCATNCNEGWQLNLSQLFRVYFNKQRNTIIRSETKIDFVYISMGNYISEPKCSM